MITIDISDTSVLDALDRFSRTGRDLRPVLEDIGEYMVMSTKRRFATSTAPDGSKWAHNSDVTILRYLSAHRRKDGSSTSYNKKGGGLSQAGMKRLVGKKPLIGETGSLSSQISWQMDGNNGVQIGSPMQYAAAQQFGMERGYAGTDRRGRPLPWGDIPARAFLGVSEQDARDILDIVEEHLMP
ncbi:MAG: phage virion morphogenesis protein [Thiobacillus sp.]|nr:phage virion morphogenesis protein [Thiobacillus sp.]